MGRRNVTGRQIALFPVPRPGRSRRRDPATSKAAARSVDTNELECRVLGYLAENGPATSHDIAEGLPHPLVSISPRLKPLVERNLVRDSGKRKAGASGRKSIVWEVVQ